MARGRDTSTTTIVRSRVDSALGSWLVTSFEPRAGDVLCGVVQTIWLFSGSTSAPRERVFPDGTLELVFQLDGAYRPVDERGAGEPFAPLSIGGVRTHAMTIEAPARPVRVLGIRLYAAGACALLRTSLHPIADLTVELADVIGPAATDFAEECADARDDIACVDAALAWLRARVCGAPQTPHLVAVALARIEADGGDLAMAQIAELGSTSRARFTAAFRDYVGVTPKRFARIVRFRRALALVQTGTAPLGTIAANVGYFDQPHMNAEFRAHAGMTPNALRDAERYPNSQSLALQNFQDDAAIEA
ncbi:MAG: hypothetical protein NVSMB19_26140 [Vulcanimicrobiaceae bacterium]